MTPEHDPATASNAELRRALQAQIHRIDRLELVVYHILKAGSVTGSSVPAVASALGELYPSAQALIDGVSQRSEAIARVASAREDVFVIAAHLRELETQLADEPDDDRRAELEAERDRLQAQASAHIEATAGQS